MAQLRDKSGRFVKTTPDYKALYEEQRQANIALNKNLIEMKGQRDYYKKWWAEAESKIQEKQRLHEVQLSGLQKMYCDAVAHMGWLRRLIFGFRAV